MLCDTEYQRVRLINQDVRFVQTNDLVGKCSNQVHRGYLTKALLKKHDCIAKKCPFLKKLETTTYWETQKNIEERKKKEQAAKKKARLRKSKLEEKTNSILKEAGAVAKEGGYNIVFTSIAQKSQKGYFLFYVSDKKRNDWEDYTSLIHELYLRFGIFCRLVHIKDMNGQYVTTEEWNAIRKKGE